MKVTTKISVDEKETTITRKIVLPSKTGARQKTLYSYREENGNKNILLNVEKAILYVALLLLVLHLIRQDALQSFSGIESTYLFIDEVQTLLLLFSSSIGLVFSLSKREDSYQSVFDVLFSISAYVLLLEQGISFTSSYDSGIAISTGAALFGFTGLRLYNRESLAEDFQMYAKSKSYVLAAIAILLIFFLPFVFSGENFMQVEINSVCISFADKMTMYMQLLGNVLLLFAIIELAVKVTRTNKIDDIFE